MPEIENSGTEIKNTIDMLNNVEVMRENVTRDRRNWKYCYTILVLPDKWYSVI